MTVPRGCKYSGSLEALREAFDKIGALGKWPAREQPLQYTFRSCEGEIVNWWPRTRTLQFQGHTSPEFAEGLLSALGRFVHESKRERRLKEIDQLPLA